MSRLGKFFQALVILVIGIVAAVVTIWWLMQLLREEEEIEHVPGIPARRPEDVNIPLPLQPVDDSLDNDAAPQTDSDDLTVIDGIGPKYAAALKELGITSFARLQEQEPDALAEKLKAQGVRIIGDRIRNEDWIGQAARLATDESN